MSAPPPMPRFSRMIPLAVAVALFMENLDSTIIATAVPVVARSLHVTSLSLSLAVSVYLLSLAVFIPMSGWMADRFGARTVFVGAIALFTFSSALCGAAQSLAMLIGARALQGVGGAMMMPVGRLILGRSIPKRELVMAMSYVTIPALVGPMLGPLVGGAITTYASWRWIFYINVPIGLAGIAFVMRAIDNIRDPVVRPLDVVGFVQLGVGLAGLVLGIENIGRGLLPEGVETGFLAVAAVALSLYRRHAGRVAAPALDLRLFRIPTFRASVIGGAISRVGFGATPFLLPLLFQLGFHRTPLESGALTFTGAIGAVVMKLTAPPLLRLFGFRNILLGNAVLVGLTSMAFALFRSTTPWFVIVAIVGLSGFLRTLQFTCMSALAYADLDPARMSNGTAIVSVGQQISMSLGVAVGATILHIATHWAGASAPTAAVFVPTFLLVGAIPLGAILVFARLPPGAAAEMTGRPDPGEPARVSAAE
jgi:EmrB/QacA subfamily drug resistance transporter